MTQETAKPAQEQRSKNKLTLILILTVSIAPLALAYFSFFTGIGVPGNTASAGTVVNPAISVENLLANDSGDYYQQMLKDKKWHLFIPLYKACGKECEDFLHTTRQVHIRLGSKGVRLDRTVINFMGEEGLAYLDSISAGHPGLKNVSTHKREWQNWLEQSPTLQMMQEQAWYLLVDQEGFAMMYYTAEIDGGDLLKDLKRALKHSIDYQ